MNAIMNNDSNHPQPYNYLFSCWDRATKEKYYTKQKDPLRNEKINLLNKTAKLASSFALLCFTETSFDIPIDPIVSRIAQRMDVQIDFLIEILNRAEEQEIILYFLNTLLPIISNLMKNISEYRDAIPYLTILQVLIKKKAVAAVFTQINGFFLDSPLAPAFEVDTILGPFYAISPLKDTTAVKQYNRDVVEPTQKMIGDVSRSLQLEHNLIIQTLFDVTNQIIRGSARSRQDMIKYFAIIVNSNKKRRAMQSKPEEISSDAFMVNITVILSQLCSPFLDIAYKKIDKIDLDFFKHSRLLDIDEETKLFSDNKIADEYFGTKNNKSLVTSTPSDDSNFISNIFYLTVAYHHFGLGGLFQHEEKLKKEIKELESRIKQAETLTGNSNASYQTRLIIAMLPRFKIAKNRAKSIQDSIMSFVTNDQLQPLLFDFVLGLSTFMTRVIDPENKHPQKKVSLPIKDAVNDTRIERFKYFPEYFLEIVSGYCIYVSRFQNNPVYRNLRLDIITEFSVSMLRTAEMIRNPYLKSKIVEFLFIGSLETRDGAPGFMLTIYDTNDLCLNHLLHALIEFYTQVEQTGASSQFYDKFNIRYHISEILDKLWHNQYYRNLLEKESKEDVDFFVKFVALMLNDTTYLLDESLAKLQEIHSTQSELDAHAKNPSDIPEPAEGEQPQTPQERQQELEGRLQSAERMATSYVALANKTVALLGLFTDAVPAAFSIPEIVDRLAAMLDYNLTALVGPKCRDLKVRDPSKYQFDPKELLRKICTVYIHLSLQNDFVKAIARDGRSYNAHIFVRAIDISKRHGLLPIDDIHKLETFAKKAEEAKISEDEGEMELGEIPDEFLDPLMYTLMENPVVLPGSKISIDLSTIKTHLLSDPTDPFNRMPLKLEDVTPDLELKEKINVFIKEKKEEARQKRIQELHKPIEGETSDVEMADS